MVNIRPLLFINFILLVMLATVGFAPKPDQVVADSVPKPKKDLPIETANSPAISRAVETKPQSETIRTEPVQRVTAEPPVIKTDVAGASSLDVEIGDAIFADELPDLGFESAPVARAEPQARVEPQKEVVRVQSLQPAVTTGSLTIRSNVKQDTVLIDGRPYGSTRLDVDLTPGTYRIEVAKAGYRSWERDIDIRLGQEKTLSALLEAYTKVEFIDGEWRNDVLTGEGTYTESNTLEYRGSFVDGQFHGVGSVRYDNGLRYQGEWFQGLKQGEGTLTTAEGDVYVGTMENDSFNGQGTLTKANGDIYTGYWIDDVLNGQGTLTTSEGLLYVGGFSENVFHGTGSLTYPDGGHYEGSFSSGLYHGKGIETYASGKRYEGQFVEGLYHGQGEILNPNGSKISGTFKEGEPYGKATLTTAQGEVFSARTTEPGICYRPKSYRATDCPELEGW